MPKRIVEELLAAYNDLRRFLASRLANPHDAADVAQASFERVYAYGLSATISAPRALLFRTAQNLCIDRGRRRQFEARLLESFGATLATAAPSAERVAAGCEAITRIAARLARLPRKRCEVFLLVRVYGYSHAEAAERMKLSIAAVEKHVVRAVLDCSDLFERFKSD